jgi:hypothetical protein
MIWRSRRLKFLSALPIAQSFSLEPDRMRPTSFRMPNF